MLHILGQVHLSDKSIPVKVTIKDLTLVPADEDDSSLPIAILSYEVENITDQPMEVSVSGSIRNFIGKDGSQFRTDWKGDYLPLGSKNNKNEYRKKSVLQGRDF